jgi:predicted O-methyltransferase YrrM
LDYDNLEMMTRGLREHFQQSSKTSLSKRLTIPDALGYTNPHGSERSTAELIQILVLSSARKRVLEIGTSNGYSALWLASALRRVPQAQRLTTIEHDAHKVQQARTNIATAGLSEMITVHEGSATEIILTLPGPFDCIFFDADRISAPEQLRILLPKLERDVLLLADNVLSHPEEVAGYLKEFEHLPEFVTSIVTVGKGLHIAYRTGVQELQNLKPPNRVGQENSLKIIA